jgi:hypothetical protein
MKKSPSTLETTIRRHINPRWISTAICCSLVSLFGLASQAATIVWSGASGTDTNWSTGANWSGAVAPGGSDDVKFYDAGTNLTTGLPNSLVDAAFGGYVGSLQFGQTNGLHTVFIPAGQTLNVTNGNLVVGTPGDVGVAKTSPTQSPARVRP